MVFVRAVEKSCHMVTWQFSVVLKKSVPSDKIRQDKCIKIKLPSTCLKGFKQDRQLQRLYLQYFSVNISLVTEYFYIVIYYLSTSSITDLQFVCIHIFYASVVIITQILWFRHSHEHAQMNINEYQHLLNSNQETSWSIMRNK